MPANSFDGMHDGGYDDHARHTQTTETEEEDAVIDQGDGYKLSIMRKKRPLPAIIDDPTEEVPPALKRRESNFLEFPRFDGPSANGRRDTAAVYSPNFPSPIEEHKDEHKEDKESSHYSSATTGEGRESSSSHNHEDSSREGDDEGVAIPTRNPD